MPSAQVSSFFLSFLLSLFLSFFPALFLSSFLPFVLSSFFSISSPATVLHVSAQSDMQGQFMYTGFLSTSCSLSVRQGSPGQMSKAARPHCSSSGRVRLVTTACRAWLSCCAVHLSNSRPAQMLVCGMQLSSLLCHCHWRLYNPRSRSACTGHVLHIFTVTLMPCCLTASSAASFKTYKPKTTWL